MKKTLKIKRWNGPNAVTCARHLCDKPNSIFLDSSRSTHPLSKWSFICFDPIEVIRVKNETITLNDSIIGETDFFDFVQSRLDHYSFKDKDVESHIPFIGGAAGYWGYDLGRSLENLTKDTIDDMDVPDAIIGIYDKLLAFDHIKNEAWLIGDTKPDIYDTTYKNDTPPALEWRTNITEDEYCENIQTAIDYIYAGEIYQANLSRRFEADLPNNFEHFKHYEILRKMNSAPYSSYLNFKDVKISSSSPEQFLSINENKVLTRPIKGTLPSDENPEKLLTSSKDIAENTMIVDLLRNDLSKVCEYHSVKVPKICELETFEGLHHLVSTVEGTLKKGKTALDTLRACFPGGSITGVPKLRAMQIIEEIEKTQRGPYCGTIGYIGFDGKMESSITIRSIIFKNSKAYLQTGCGIVSDSVPTKELNESLTKACKIFDSFDKNLIKD